MSDVVGEQSRVHIMPISAKWKHKSSIHIGFIVFNGGVTTFFAKSVSIHGFLCLRCLTYKIIIIFLFWGIWAWWGYLIQNGHNVCLENVSISLFVIIFHISVNKHPVKPSHYLNQCWLVNNETLRNLTKYSFKETGLNIIHYKMSENNIIENTATSSSGFSTKYAVQGIHDIITFDLSTKFSIVILHTNRPIWTFNDSPLLLIDRIILA